MRGMNGHFEDGKIIEQDHVKMRAGLELGMSNLEDISGEFEQGRDCVESVAFAPSESLHQGKTDRPATSWDH
jgi:hypothetical protein